MGGRNPTKKLIVPAKNKKISQGVQLANQLGFIRLFLRYHKELLRTASLSGIYQRGDFLANRLNNQGL